MFEMCLTFSRRITMYITVSPISTNFKFYSTRSMQWSQIILRTTLTSNTFPSSPLPPPFSTHFGHPTTNASFSLTNLQNYSSRSNTSSSTSSWLLHGLTFTRCRMGSCLRRCLIRRGQRAGGGHSLWSLWGLLSSGCGLDVFYMGVVTGRQHWDICWLVTSYQVPCTCRFVFSFSLHR